MVQENRGRVSEQVCLSLSGESGLAVDSRLTGEFPRSGRSRASPPARQRVGVPHMRAHETAFLPSPKGKLTSGVRLAVTARGARVGGRLSIAALSDLGRAPRPRFSSPVNERHGVGSSHCCRSDAESQANSQVGAAQMEGS